MFCFSFCFASFVDLFLFPVFSLFIFPLLFFSRLCVPCLALIWFSFFELYHWVHCSLSRSYLIFSFYFFFCFSFAFSSSLISLYPLVFLPFFLLTLIFLISFSFFFVSVLFVLPLISIFSVFVFYFIFLFAPLCMKLGSNLMDLLSLDSTIEFFNIFVLL